MHYKLTNHKDDGFIRNRVNNQNFMEKLLTRNGVVYCTRLNEEFFREYFPSSNDFNKICLAVS